MTDPFTKPMCVIITGTSRGYGLALAEIFLKQLAKGSILLLCVRTKNGLENVIENLTKIANENNVNVFWVEADLNKLEDVQCIMEKCASNVGNRDFESAMIIHNASTLGDPTKKFDEYNDAKVISEFMTMNVAYVMFLTAKFLEVFAKKHCFVVNISSLCAIQPMPSMAMYCSAKAARNMAFKVLAKEREDVRVLNWAPGPMPTDMFFELTKTFNTKMADYFNTMVEDKTYTTCADSGAKLVALLRGNKFVSGDHIDLYDV